MPHSFGPCHGSKYRIGTAEVTMTEAMNQIALPLLAIPRYVFYFHYLSAEIISLSVECRRIDSAEKEI